MMGYYGSMMGGGMIVWAGLALIVLLGVAAAVALLVAFILQRTKSQQHEHGGTTAVDVLRTRFAAGEIDEDEFRRRLATLK